jgi:hypothetical protein
MTKLFSIIAVAVLATTFVSCGPSAEEKAKIAEREAFMKDSIAKALEASIEGAMTAETAPADTTAAAETTEAAPAAEAGH